MVISRKLVTAIVTNVLGYAVALVVTKLGLHLSTVDASAVSTAVGIAAGAVTGFLVKEIPDL